MKKNSILILTAVSLLAAVFAWGLSGCGNDAGGDTGPDGSSGAGITNDGEKDSDEGKDLDEGNSDGAPGAARVDYENDAYDLMGMDYHSFLEKYDESMIVDFQENAMGSFEGDYYYLLNNGVEVIISADSVVSVRTIYNIKTEHPVPVMKGIGGEDGYDDAVAALGKPHYEAPELTGEGEDKQEFDTAVFNIEKYLYLKMYFDSETKLVSHIACFYGP